MPDVVREMQRAASQAWSPGSFWHVGGLAWQAAGIRHTGARVRLVEDGWGWIEQGAYRQALLPDRHDPAPLVDWFVEGAGGELTAAIPSGCTGLLEALRARGFRPAPDAPYAVDLRLPTTGVAAAPPPGYVVRPLGDGEQPALVACHRAAWNPHLLPWPPGRRPDLEPGAAGPFSAELFATVEATWPYRRELVTVVEAPDGTLAGSCIAWLDDAIGVAEIEPLGVVAARRLYENCGFRAVARTVPMVRPAAGMGTTPESQ